MHAYSFNRKNGMIDLLIDTWETIKSSYGCHVLRYRLNYLSDWATNSANAVLIISLLKCKILLTIASMRNNWLRDLHGNTNFSTYFSKIHWQLLKKSFDVFFNFNSIICLIFWNILNYFRYRFIFCLYFCIFLRDFFQDE